MSRKLLYLSIITLAVIVSCAAPRKANNQSKTIASESTNPSEEEDASGVIKILAIGNSFSEDAVEQELYGLFAAAGKEVIIGNLYIGGCPLSKHVANAASDSAAYSYRKIVDGVKTKNANTKMSTAFQDEEWTYISIQEGAGYHGYYNTTYGDRTHSMEPDLTNLIQAVQEACPKAKIIYHCAWSAKNGYEGVKFSYYDYSQALMNQMLRTATQQVLRAHPEISIVINSMDAVQNARSSFIGDSLQRDGWHLNHTTGRYTVSCLWYEKITGQNVLDNPYYPATISEAAAIVCKTAAHEANIHPYADTDLSYLVDY